MLEDMSNGGSSVEDVLDLWAAELRSAKERIALLFTQKRVATSACAFLDVLVANEPRKTGWMRAEAARDLGPWRQQALLGRSHWGADVLRNVVREQVVEHLGTKKGVLVIDETGFLRKVRHPAVWGGNIQALPARSRTAGLACLVRMCRSGGMPLLTVPCIFPRIGHRTVSA